MTIIRAVLLLLLLWYYWYCGIGIRDDVVLVLMMTNDGNGVLLKQ